MSSEAVMETSKKQPVQKEIEASSEQKNIHSQDKNLSPIVTSTQLPAISNIEQFEPAKTKAIELSIPKTTELSISTSIDWIAFLGFAITAVIVIFTSRQTMKQSIEVIKSQEALSRDNAKENISLTKSELTASNRQAWINTLRNDLASFIAASNVIWDLHRVKDGRDQVLAELKKPEYAMGELFEWSIKYNSALQNAEQLSAKIKLLLNPNEDKSKILSNLLDETMQVVKNKKDPTSLAQKIIEVSQSILKKEWERVKNLT
ncbi:hypothetical protein [Gallaecimonas pentaromativorans]|uniref:hypothetical protein n=1 Tax=Gallaecimonas pentaromativorans TaxID=584787 RepID=UPI003A95C926